MVDKQIHLSAYPDRAHVQHLEGRFPEIPDEWCLSIKIPWPLYRPDFFLNLWSITKLKKRAAVCQLKCSCIKNEGIENVLLLLFRLGSPPQVISRLAYQLCGCEVNVLDVPIPLLRYQPNDKDHCVIYGVAFNSDMRLARAGFSVYRNPSLWA